MLKIGDQVNINVTIQGKTVIATWISEVDTIQSDIATLKIGVVNGSASMQVPVSKIKPGSVPGEWLTEAQVSSSP